MFLFDFSQLNMLNTAFKGTILMNQDAFIFEATLSEIFDQRQVRPGSLFGQNFHHAARSCRDLSWVCSVWTKPNPS